MAFDPSQPFDVGAAPQQSASRGFDPSQPADIAAPAERSVASDTAHGAGLGAVKGAGVVLGMPSDLWQMLDRGYQYAMTKGAEKLGLLTPEQGAALRQPIPGAEDYHANSEAINQHLLSIAKAAGADTSEPTTLPGQYAETVGSFLPGAAAFGAGSAKEIPKALLRYGALPGAASETAGQVTKGTALEPYARVLGAVAPEALLQGAGAAGRAVNPLRRTMSGVSDTQATDAQALLDQSRATGAPLTVPEAIDKTTGRATNIGDVARVVEQSPVGGPTMKGFFAQRPGQVEQAGQSALDQIGPGSLPTTEIGPRVQSAAETVVSDANKARTAAVDPFYKAAATDRVPTPTMNNFLNRIDAMIASDKTGIMGPELSNLRDRLIETPATPGTPAQRIPTTTPTGATIYKTVPAVPPTPAVPITDIENLDRVRKYFRDRLDLPQWAQDATSKEEGAKISSLLGDLRGHMINASPDFAAGKNLYQHITENDFNPLTRSPTGQLAGADDWKKQAQVILADNPDPRSHLAVGKAVSDVAATDPEAASELVRAKLEKTFSEATQSNMPGPNQFGAPKFAATVMGNPQQAKNLEAAVRALPNGDTRWAAFNRTMDIFKAMGTRQPVGSQTAFNQQMNAWLREHPGSLPMEFASVAASPGKWLTMARDLYHNVAYGQRTGELARVFTQGNVKDLRAIVGAPARSARAQAALVTLLAREGAGSGQDPRPDQP